jgi:predicted TIM-barrel fold metal-dependent hydrolase
MVEVFDVHHHVGRAFDALGGELATEDELDRIAAVELQERLATMDEGGVHQAMVIPGHGYLRPNGIADTRAVNDAIAAYRDATPQRFPVACGIVEPTHGEASFAEIDRCASELRLVGLSFHTRFQGVSLDSRWIHRYLQRMGEAGLVPVIHAMDDTPEEALWKLATLARAFPDLAMLVLDGFSGFEATRQCFHVAEAAPNLVWDTSLSYNFDFIEDFARRFGAERVVFGTDLYSHPVGRRISHLLPQIRASSLSEAEQAAILGDNARRLLRVP